VDQVRPLQRKDNAAMLCKSIDAHKSQRIASVSVRWCSVLHQCGTVVIPKYTLQLEVQVILRNNQHLCRTVLGGSCGSSSGVSWQPVGVCTAEQLQFVPVAALCTVVRLRFIVQLCGLAKYPTQLLEFICYNALVQIGGAIGSCTKCC
jgi:hypothetical protein